MDQVDINWLREIVSQDEWDEDELMDWANAVLADYRDVPGFDEDEYRQERDLMDELKPLVAAYQHDPTLPELPSEPDGSLNGIGFIYDEDQDDRILVAIEKLRDNRDVIAVAEHEGVVKIYSRLPTGLNGLSVCHDEWSVTEFVPFQGQWIEADQRFINDCVAQVIGYKRKKSASWQDDPATEKQISYLRALGYRGATPKSKGEAGALIAEYRTKSELPTSPILRLSTE